MRLQDEKPIITPPATRLEALEQSLDHWERILDYLRTVRDEGVKISYKLLNSHTQAPYCGICSYALSLRPTDKGRDCTVCGFMCAEEDSPYAQWHHWLKQKAEVKQLISACVDCGLLLEDLYEGEDYQCLLKT